VSGLPLAARDDNSLRFGQTQGRGSNDTNREGSRLQMIDGQQMVGERGFEPPTPWSQTSFWLSILLNRLARFCVLLRYFRRYSELSGPKLDPSFFRSLDCLADPFSQTTKF